MSAASGRRGSRSGRRGSRTASLPPDAGSGSLLVIGVVVVILLLGAALAALGRAQVARAQAQSAADLAALAAAGVLWTPPGVAVAEVALESRSGCSVAERVTERNGAELVDCRAEGSVVSVVVRRPSIAGAAVGRARAGPVP